jgi:phosphoglycolate phosphatase-like HAD superfamily hydrolase
LAGFFLINDVLSTCYTIHRGSLPELLRYATETSVRQHSLSAPFASLHLCEMKLILFDIDGTLVRVSHEVSMQVVREVFRQTFAHDGELPDLEFHGKTDRQIFLELCGLLGIAHADASCRLDEMGDALIEAWQRHLNADTVHLLAGVSQTLDALAERDDVMLGLLTGNLETSARIKLATHDLNRYFPIGSYGSDAIDRLELPPIALERANALNGHTITYRQTMIVGDSHRDIACARAWEITSFAVATGSLRAEELLAYQPDAVAESLLDNSFIFDFLDSTP